MRCQCCNKWLNDMEIVKLQIIAISYGKSIEDELYCMECLSEIFDVTNFDDMNIPLEQKELLYRNPDRDYFGS